ncbi:hypothetical protein FACS1894169_02280 [Bacteroidia bacterium]|nr:hypothetical protein FACS1894169_02280 [Bacteroidia bacterium]
MKKILSVLMAVIGSAGVIYLIISDYYGGMFIHMLSYGIILLPLLGIYFVSLVSSLISVIKAGVKENKLHVLILSLPIILFLASCIYDTEFLKSPKVLTAEFKDDLFYYTLIFRENGDCEHEISVFLGYEEVIKGKYYFKGDTIIFTKKPYDNYFIPDTILIDRDSNKLLLKRDSLGNFNKEYNYFNIIKNGK